MTDAFVYLCAGSVGLLIGSFLNVVIHRGPALWRLVDVAEPRGGLAHPRSYCPSCRKTLSPFELIPVFSFLISGGRCRSCRARISWRYPAIELAGAGAALASVFLFGVTVSAGLFALFAWTAIALAAIDLETGYLPDALTLPLIAIGIGANITGRFSPTIDALIGAVVGCGVFYIVSVTFKRVRNVEGLGLGDAKLLAAIGAWGGWIVLAPTVFLAALATLIGAALARVFGIGVERNTELPFGPALALAGLVCVAVNAINPNAFVGGAFAP